MSSNDTPTKTCTQCGKPFPATTEYWHRHKGHKDGFDYFCKQCKSENAKQWREKNHKRILEQRRQYRSANTERLRKENREYYAKHIEERREYHKRYRENNRESRIEYNKKYRVNNKERLTEYNRQYKEEHRNHGLLMAKQWRKNNPEIVRNQGRTRRARKRNAEGIHTAADIEAQVTAQTGEDGKLRCWWCGKVIKGAYHIDHRIPLSKGGSNDASNLCIAHTKCNLSKGNKMPWEFNGRLL